MSTFNPTATSPGAINGAGDDRALFLKIYGGEVLTTFSQTTQALDKHKVRTVRGGKSAQFPVMGRSTGAEYLTRGNSVNTADIPHSERIITIDDKIVSSALIYDYDELMLQYEIRQEYSRKHGEEIAVLFDTNVLSTGILAARANSVVTGGDGGTVVVNANAKTDASALSQSLYDARQALMEKNVMEDACAFLLPAQYMLLLNGEDRLINSDFGDNGSWADARATKIAGLKLVMTNNLPNSARTGTFGNKYDVDATNTAALVMTESAVGTAKLHDMKSEMEYKTEFQANLLVSSLGVGHGILRPECAVEIATA